MESVDATSSCPAVRLVPAGVPAGLHDLAPWFWEYGDEFLRVTGWGEHAAIDYPVAGVCMHIQQLQAMPCVGSVCC
jgi:hypothetical protein